MKIILGNAPASDGAGTVTMDLDKLMVSRALLQANSGAGKSWALRRLLEQTHGHVQQIIIDPEDEFYTLREKYDYILVRHDDGDAIPDVRSAELLATKLLELGVSAIISLYELPPRDRREFVKRFLESLVNARKELWHQVLVVIDEADGFAPEQGKGAKQRRDESGGCVDAVISLMAKGRKRGFCGLLATQRISKLNKDAAAECNNVFIGRCAIDNDRKRAAESLGINDKARILALRQMRPGDFFAFGPAISNEVITLRFGGVSTTHPKAGAAPTPVAPPKHKITAALTKLGDVVKQAEEERVTVETLRQRVRELESRQQDDTEPNAIQTDRIEHLEDLIRDRNAEIARLAGSHNHRGIQIRRIAAELIDLAERDAELSDIPRDTETTSRKPAACPECHIVPPGHKIGCKTGNDRAREYQSQLPRNRTEVIARRRSSEAATDEGSFQPTGTQQRILNEAAKLHRLRVSHPTLKQIAVFCGVSPTTGSFLQNVRDLDGAGYLTRSKGSLALTDLGNKAADATLSGRNPLEMWTQKLDGARAKMLQAIYIARSVTKHELAATLGVSPTTGSFLQNLRDLRNYGIVEIDNGEARPSPLLFPPGIR